MAPKGSVGGADEVSPASPSAAMPDRLTVALVRGVRGLKGHVRVELLTDRPEDRFTIGARLFVEGTPQVLTIAEASAVADGPGWWLRFAEIPSREAADALRGRYLEIEPPAEPREPGQWFFHELIGLAVRTSEGEDLGVVKDIYRAGGAEVFVVRGPRGEIDIPGVRSVVTDLAPERGELIVDMAVLDLDARPVDDDDYVRPRDRRPKKQPKAKGPAQPPKGTPPVPKPPKPVPPAE
jgi:16S rRNA processing protein RimM